MEFDTVAVVHWELGCEPNWKKGHHESFGLVYDGEFVDDKEDKVHVRHRDRYVIDEGRNGFNPR